MLGLTNDIRQGINEKVLIPTPDNNLSGAGDLYIVTDTRKNPRKELDKIRSLQQYNIEPYTPDNAVMSESGTVLFPVKDLNFDRKNFQNRETDFSDESVLKIIKAVKSGKFNWSIFDAITIWQNPTDGKFYVLSGHSRSEAFKRLADMGAQADGKDFSKIPAKIFKGTLDEARELALNSNTLSTKETNFERANYYRSLYNAEISKGRSKAEATNLIMPIIKEREGKNANSIFYISFLNPNGIFYDALRQLQNAPTQDRERLKVIGEWVGRLRKDRSKLTDFHERELFNYLITEGNYNKTVSNYADLLKRIDTALLKMVDEKGNFQPEQSLNLKKNIVAESNEKAFLQELDRLKRVAADEDNLYNQKLAEFRNRQKIDSTITDNQILKAVEPYRQRAILAKADYNAFRQKRAQYIDADRRQMSLFGLKDSGLGKPTIKFEFENNDELKNFLKENKENLIDSYIDVDSDSEKADYSRKRLNGLTHNAEQYNYKELDTKGYAPTYEILSNYDNLIESSDGKILEVGKGFADTCECLKNAVLKGLPQVERLAKLLQDPAGNIAQSCFNVWHFLQKNVRYNFDRTGKEDIRLPARTWADREKGVDCDCLSVFAFCLLANMGLKPVFEIVAFFGKDSYSHIYVNCQGVIVDRVLQKFNERAPFVTKIKKMEIPVYQLSGVKNDGLEGVNDVLKNLKSQIPQNHNCQIRKQIAYKRMAGNPVEQRAFAMFMPYMYDVDLHNGALYFYRPEFATVAKWADSILANYFRNAQQCTDLQGVELGKLFKKIGKALKKAAKSVAKATKKVVKATGNVVKSAVKSTANVVKSTANVVKAGAQLATGKKAAAKATIKKAGSQIKSAVVEPVKSTANLTKTVVKETIVNPTKTAVKAVAKLVKVLLIKINPVTVLMRNSLRGLIAINFLGLASKLAVGKMTQSDAEKAGYDKSSWEKAVKAYNRVIKFFKNLGGDVSKMEKSITNGAKKKALFKKNNNYNINAPISESDLQGLGALGEAVTIGTMLAAVGGFFAKIWGWIKNVVQKVANFVKNSGVGEKLKNAALNKLDEKLNNNKDSEFTDAQFNDDTPATDTTSKNWILPALLIGGAVAAVAMSGKRK